jgi:hypothetical protein
MIIPFPRFTKVFAAIQDWRLVKTWKSDACIFFAKQEKVLLSTSISLEDLYWNKFEAKDIPRVLKQYFEELKFKQVRIGVRWDKFFPSHYSKNTPFDFSFYDDFLREIEKYCDSYGVKVTLNIGPIKIFRWPESHIPESVKKELEGLSAIEWQVKLEEIALEYFKRLLPELSKRYPVLMKHTTQLQLDNEAFNSFGTSRFVPNESYLISTVRLAQQAFPLIKNYVWNGPGHFHIPQQIKLIERLNKNFNYVIGLDYYYSQDVVYWAKWTRFLDPLSTYNIGLSSPDIRAEMSYLKQKGFSVSKEITEAQMEGWGRAQHPGSSITELCWVLKRCARFFSPGEKKIISLWGLENFLRRMDKKDLYTDGNHSLEKDLEIKKVITQINLQDSFKYKIE